jgi:cytochrome c-type biogenesis CcmH protein
LKLFRKALLAIVLLSSLGWAADTDRFNTLGGQFMCPCGCRQLLGGPYGCTMPGCPSANPMREELKQLIADGKTDKEIRTTYVEKYGATILSAPTTTGFDIAAWVMPFVALAAGLLVVAYIVRLWKSRTPQAASTGPIDVKYQDRVEEELKKYTPED